MNPASTGIRLGGSIDEKREAIFFGDPPPIPRTLEAAEKAVVDNPFDVQTWLAYAGYCEQKGQMAWAGFAQQCAMADDAGKGQLIADHRNRWPLAVAVGARLVAMVAPLLRQSVASMVEELKAIDLPALIGRQRPGAA